MTQGNESRVWKCGFIFSSTGRVRQDATARRPFTDVCADAKHGATCQRSGFDDAVDPWTILGYVSVDVGKIWIVTAHVPVEGDDTDRYPVTHQRPARVALRDRWTPLFSIWGLSADTWFCRERTWQNPLLVPYPPAQITFSGRFVQFVLQTCRLRTDTSTILSLCTVGPSV